MRHWRRAAARHDATVMLSVSAASYCSPSFMSRLHRSWSRQRRAWQCALNGPQAKRQICLDRLPVRFTYFTDFLGRSETTRVSKQSPAGIDAAVLRQPLLLTGAQCSHRLRADTRWSDIIHRRFRSKYRYERRLAHYISCTMNVWCISCPVSHTGAVALQTSLLAHD